MPLKQSPNGLLLPYTRERVLSNLKLTAKESAVLRHNSKELDTLIKSVRGRQPTEEEAEDILVDVALIAEQMQAVGKKNVKILKKTLAVVDGYLKKARE